MVGVVGWGGGGGEGKKKKDVAFGVWGGNWWSGSRHVFHFSSFCDGMGVG